MNLDKVKDEQFEVTYYLEKSAQHYTRLECISSEMSVIF